ncbi:hypothetical protein [Candidatus Harpocratesius sp.]
MKKKFIINSLLLGFTVGLMILSNTFVSNIQYSNEKMKSTSKYNPLPIAADDLWNNITLPAGDIPDANITLHKGEHSRLFTLTQIINYTTYENHTFQMKNYTIEKDGRFYPVIGFNPLHLFEIVGWNDIFNFTVKAGDGYSFVINTTQLLMADSDYSKYPETDNATIILIAWNNQWLHDYNPDYGNFYIWGENIIGKQKIRDIRSIDYTDPWTLTFTVNGTKVGYFNSQNNTNSVNFTSYTWGYFDNASGYGWSKSLSTGFTVASLMHQITNENYNISFIAYDGYGANMVFTKEQMENGFTGTMINDPAVELSNEGKQAMLMVQKDGEDLGFSRGPYQLIIPGASKKNYIGGVIEIKITIIPSELSENNNIPGYTFNMLGMVSIGIFALVFNKIKKKNKMA